MMDNDNNDYVLIKCNICVCDDQLPECFISYVLYVYEWGSCAVSHGDVLRMLA